MILQIVRDQARDSLLKKEKPQRRTKEKSKRTKERLWKIDYNNLKTLIYFIIFYIFFKKL